MPNGKEFPALFDFTREGTFPARYFGFLPRSLTGSGHVSYIELSVRPDLMRQLVPTHCEAELGSRGIVLDSFVPIPLEQLRISLD